MNRFNLSLKLPWVLFVLFYAIFVNFPFWVASRLLGLLPIGWVCVEYAGVGLLFLVIPRAIASLLLLAMIAADILSAVSKTYYLSPTECLANAFYLHNLSGPRILAIISVMAISFITVMVAFLLPTGTFGKRDRLTAAGCLIGFAVLTLAVDYVSVVREIGHVCNPFQGFRPSDVNRFSRFSTLWTGRYPLLRLERNQTLFSVGHHDSVTTLGTSPSVPSAAALAIRLGGIGAGKPSPSMENLVVILVESWGLDSDSSIQTSLVAPYFHPNVEAEYRIVQGSVPFHGSTVGGETRELCGSTVGFRIMNVPSEGLRTCLPDQLESLGYHSVALHGMSGHVFDRSTWYRTIGFQEEWFRDLFRQEGMPECEGAFIGTCDSAIAKVIERRLELKSDKPDFLYWVTLTSHLPVPIPSGLESGAPCSSNPALSSSPALCSWYQLVENVHNSVAQLATARLSRPTVFAIVGDHAPPFANPQLRSRFSSENVPYVLLIPR